MAGEGGSKKRKTNEGKENCEPSLRKALRFSLSPVKILSNEAIQAKRERPDKVKLMVFENTSLTVEDAEARVRKGEDILMSPLNRKTNETFHRMQEIAEIFKGVDLGMIQRFFEELDPQDMDTTFLYKNLGSSPDVCEVDLVQVVAYCLDQTTKLIFRMEQPIFNNLVGPGLAFSSTTGNGITYSRLLWFYERQVHSPLHSLAEDLLLRAEFDFLTEFKALSSMGHPIPTISPVELREEMQGFAGCLLKRDRLLAAHLLSELLYLDKNQPLGQQDLSGRFHTLKASNWRFSNLKTVVEAGMRVLVLEDLEKRFEKGLLRHQGYLVPFIGIFLMKHFLEQKIPHSLRVRFGSLEATLKKQGQDVKDEHNYDLRVLKKRLPDLHEASHETSSSALRTAVIAEEG